MDTAPPLAELQLMRLERSRKPFQAVPAAIPWPVLVHDRAGPSRMEQMAGVRWIHDRVHRERSRPFVVTDFRKPLDAWSWVGLPAANRRPASAGLCPRKRGPCSNPPRQEPLGHMALAQRRTAVASSPALAATVSRSPGIGSTGRAGVVLGSFAGRMPHADRSDICSRPTAPRAREVLPTEHRVPSLASEDGLRRSSASGGAEILGLASDAGESARHGCRVIMTANLHRIIKGRTQGQCRARP